MFWLKLNALHGAGRMKCRCVMPVGLQNYRKNIAALWECISTIFTMKLKMATETEFKNLLSHYVEMLNAGKIMGLRMFAAYQFIERPEYVDWASDVLQHVTCR